MITVKFPNIHKSLAKNTKDFSENDPRKGVIVIGNNAIVYQMNFILIINLFDFFQIEQGIVSEEDIRSLKKILFYMNGKVFPLNYWKELTVGANISIVDGVLSVETPKYSKDLHYKPLDINFSIIINKLKRTESLKEFNVGSIAIPFQPLNLIYSCLDLKNDHIIFSFSGESDLIKFTFKNKDYCYGCINPNTEAVSVPNLFYLLEEFVNSDEFEVIESLFPPLPPKK